MAELDVSVGDYWICEWDVVTNEISRLSLFGWGALFSSLRFIFCLTDRRTFWPCFCLADGNMVDLRNNLRRDIYVLNTVLYRFLENLLREAPTGSIIQKTWGGIGLSYSRALPFCSIN